MAKHGCVYLQVIAENKPFDIIEQMENFGFRSFGVCLIYVLFCFVVVVFFFFILIDLFHFL
jgi:hypothetical protein